jgi:hypothetical protein
VSRLAYSWTPTDEARRRTNVFRLQRRLGCADYDELHRVSMEEPERFWREVVADLGLPLARDWERTLDTSRGVEWPSWFEGARLNLAEACVHRWARETPDREATVWAPEQGERRSLTWAELSHEVRRLAEALHRLGVAEGDRVGTFLPMAPEAAIASHACAHLGAVQVPVFSGFAAPAVRSRLVEVFGLRPEVGQVLLYTAPLTARAIHESRDRRFVVAELTMYPGRAPEVKEKLLQELKAVISQKTGVPAGDICPCFGIDAATASLIWGPLPAGRSQVSIASCRTLGPAVGVLRRHLGFQLFGPYTKPLQQALVVAAVKELDVDLRVQGA